MLHEGFVLARMRLVQSWVQHILDPTLLSIQLRVKAEILLWEFSYAQLFWDYCGTDNSIWCRRNYDSAMSFPVQSGTLVVFSAFCVIVRLPCAFVYLPKWAHQKAVNSNLQKLERALCQTRQSNSGGRAQGARSNVGNRLRAITFAVRPARASLFLAGWSGSGGGFTTALVIYHSNWSNLTTRFGQIVRSTRLVIRNFPSLAHQL